jgi:hypothetical protein
MGEQREAGVMEMLDGEIAVPALRGAAGVTLLREYQTSKDEDLVGQTSRNDKFLLNALRERGVRSHNVSQMSYSELATCLAAFLVEYHEMRWPQFDELQRCLGVLFLENGISGTHLVGDHAVSAEEFFEFVVDGLRADHICRPAIGYKSSLRRFLALLETG